MAQVGYDDPPVGYQGRGSGMTRLVRLAATTILLVASPLWCRISQGSEASPTSKGRVLWTYKTGG